MQHNHIIGEFSINGSVKFIGLSGVWGSVLPYVANPRAPEATRGWGSTSYTSSTNSKGWVRSSVNTSSNNVTVIWGVSLTCSIVNWGGSVNASPCNGAVKWVPGGHHQYWWIGEWWCSGSLVL